MAVPNLPNTWRVIVKYGVNGTHFENVLHVTAPTSALPSDVAADVAAAWNAAGSLKTKQSNICAFETISVQPYDGVTAPIDVIVPGFTGSGGTAVSPPAPIQVAGLCTLRTLQAGRSHRGRIYVGAWTDGDVDADGTRWSSTALSSGQTAFDNFLTTIHSRTHVTSLEVYSPKLNAKAAVVSMVFRQYFGTQRRRAEQRM